MPDKHSVNGSQIARRRAARIAAGRAVTEHCSSSLAALGSSLSRADISLACCTARSCAPHSCLLVRPPAYCADGRSCVLRHHECTRKQAPARGTRGLFSAAAPAHAASSPRLTPHAARTAYERCRRAENESRRLGCCCARRRPPGPGASGSAPRGARRPPVGRVPAVGVRGSSSGRSRTATRQRARCSTPRREHRRTGSMRSFWRWTSDGLVGRTTCARVVGRWRSARERLWHMHWSARSTEVHGPRRHARRTYQVDRRREINAVRGASSLSQRRRCCADVYRVPLLNHCILAPPRDRR